LEKFPHSPSASAIWVSAAPSGYSARALQEDLSSVLAEDPEVCTSLAERALRDQDFNLGYLCALIAAGSKPEWAYRSLLLGQAILNDEISKCQGDTSALQYIPEGSRLREAVASFSKAIELSQAQRQPEIEATALLDRAQAEELLGEADLAQKDSRASTSPAAR